MNLILAGDALKELQKLESNSIHCCVTSPPFWGLRDYGVEGQIGLEKTPEEYVAQITLVFREVKRVLRNDGTLWVNLGDSYYGSWGSMSHDIDGKAKRSGYSSRPVGSYKHPILKSKDLVGIPWRVAFALQNDGWFLRSDIIWNKPNPMPESVRDRPTKSHEYIFLLTKSRRYYFDNAAIKEPCVSLDPSHPSFRPNSRALGFTGERKVFTGKHEKSFRAYSIEGKNKRSVWTVTTRPNKLAHTATFPEDLITPCVLAGCPPKGIVLDPFLGSGTTAFVARANDREFIGIELNPNYVEIAKKRLS